jgi:hypothetical protein
MARLELPGSTGLAEALRRVPASPGVAQLVGEAGRSLLIARPADLRRWARSQLGLGRPRRGRPATDLSGVARSLLWAETGSGFEQRLLCEKLLSANVPAAERRDLPSPFWLCLDPEERFPRVVVSPRPAARGRSWGILASRDAARTARDRLNRQFSLRPCEEEFAPAPDLPLGLACLYAQVRTCSAPCLERIGPGAYRELARRAGDFLSAPGQRPPESGAWLGSSVAPHEARSVVAERVEGGIAAWPVRGARVGAGVTAESAGEALAALLWPAPDAEAPDAAWLVDWLVDRRRTGAYRILGPGEEPCELAAELEEAARARGNVGAGRSR